MPATDPTPTDPLLGNSISGLMNCALGTTVPTTQAAPWQSPTPEHIAGLLPQYRVESLIGRGGMGAVYKGRQVSLNRPVAIKVLPAELSANAEFISRFEREARTLASLSHQGIVAIFESGQTSEGHLYFVMEFVDGTDLAQVLHSQRLESNQALELTIQICEALHYAHDMGVVHRDIKPANVLIARDGRAKLADFGLARPMITSRTQLTASNMLMGTPDYMAPEQWSGQADQRADVYALGVVLYEMLTGTKPQGAFDLPSIKSKVDARLDDVVIKAMRQEPERRYQQVSELRNDVERIRTTRPPQPAAERPQAPAHRPADRQESTKKRAVPAFGTAVLITLAVLGLGYAALMLVGKSRRQNDTRAESDASVAQAGTPKQAPELPDANPAPVPPSPSPQPLDSQQSNTPSLHSPAPSPPASLASNLPSLQPAAPSLLDRFSQQAVGLTESALAPLDRTMPSDVREKITLFRADLVDEGNTKEPASRDTYRSAYYLCQTLLSTLDERDKALDSATERAAWPARSTVLRQTLEAQYAQFRGVRTGTAPFSLIAPPPPVVAAEKPAPDQIHSFAEQGPNIAAWITSPLDVTVPEAIWENLNFLKEALKDEAAQKPAASAAAYQLAVRHCLALLTFLDERDRATTRAGGSAVLHQKSNLTQEQRDHLTWPQYMLERDERAERKANARAADLFQSGHYAVEWNNRTTQMRKEMQTLYSQLREALRQLPAPK